MPRSTETIVTGAHEARQAFESKSIARPLLRKLYLDHNPSVLDIDNYLDFTARIFPKGNCGLASIYLQHMFSSGTVVEGAYCQERSIEPHQFLMIEGLTVDITADQFGGPAVYVGPLQLPWLAD
jgi:hypothetical protein